MSRPLRVLYDAATVAMVVALFGTVLGTAWAGGYWAGAEERGRCIATVTGDQGGPDDG